MCQFILLHSIYDVLVFFQTINLGKGIKHFSNFSQMPDVGANLHEMAAICNGFFDEVEEISHEILVNCQQMVVLLV